MSHDPVGRDKDERVNADADPEEFLRALMQVRPDSPPTATPPLASLPQEEQGHPVKIASTDIQRLDILLLPEIDKNPVLVEEVIEGNVGAIRVVVQYTGVRKGQTDHVELDWDAVVTRLGRA
jgi:hypothetical protein